MYALTNCIIYTSQQILKNSNILISKDKIIDIVNDNKIPSKYKKIDLKGLSIAPGFIDLQLNGCGGLQFNDDISPNTLNIMFQTSLQFGTTNILPTLITCSDNDMKKALEVTYEYKKTNHNILGLHLEGPYINKIKKGIQNEQFIRKPNAIMVDLICQYGSDTVKMITLAPEIVDTCYIEKLKNKGIIVAAGHSNASFEEAVCGITAGISMSTHLFNAMPSISARNPGLITAILDNDQIYASIIVDGIHVDYPGICFVKRIKKNKLCLVTDGVAPVGTHISHFMLGGNEIYCRNGKCISANGTLGGSFLTMDRAVKNCVDHANIALDEALRMASLYPAQIIGFDNQLGRVASGYRANLVIFDNDIHVKGTIIDGLLYLKNNDYITQDHLWNNQLKAIST